MNIKDFTKNYWSYYLRLENEFLSTLKYVEFEKANYKTYSLEFLKMYLSVCSEIDVVGKCLASSVNPQFKIDKHTGLNKWWMEIQDKKINGKTLNDVEVNFIDIEEIKPWDNYRVEFGKRNRCVLSNGSRTPQWWCDYNSVKHARSSFNDGIRNYSKANLFNLSRAFSALYVLEKGFMEFVDKENLSLIEHSHLFEKQEKCVYGVENDCFSIEKKKMI